MERGLFVPSTGSPNVMGEMVLLPQLKPKTDDEVMKSSILPVGIPGLG